MTEVHAMYTHGSLQGSLLVKLTSASCWCVHTIISLVRVTVKLFSASCCSFGKCCTAVVAILSQFFFIGLQRIIISVNVSFIPVHFQ